MPERQKPLVERLRCWLVALVEAGALPHVERAAAGDALGRLGDPRPGVGLTAASIPDIVWCDVPESRFLMGNTKYTDEWAYFVEGPQALLTQSAYRISKYLITNTQYRAFVQDGGYTAAWRRCWTEAGWQWKGEQTGPETSDSTFGLPNHPVVNVTWHEAMAFCGWLGEKLGYPVTLPSEAQWEQAARSPDGRRYPWGSQITPQHANYAETNIGTTTAVGIFPLGISAYGALDMTGNVFEWCLTRWKEYYWPFEDDSTGNVQRVIRGGSFNSNARQARGASRVKLSPEAWWKDQGFRVVAPPIIHDSGLRKLWPTGA